MILTDSIHKAKAEGDLLIQKKAELSHGEYQEWVLKEFKGSKATARVYKRIAEYWRLIELELARSHRTNMPLREALILIKGH